MELPVAAQDAVQLLTVHCALRQSTFRHGAGFDPADTPELVGVELFPHRFEVDEHSGGAAGFGAAPGG